MDVIAYPPNCQEVNCCLEENVLRLRLKKITKYFQELTPSVDCICCYYPLWGKLNHIALQHSPSFISILAASTATEICRHFFLCFEKYSEQIIPVNNFYTLCGIINKIFKQKDDSADTYHLKCDLLQIWIANKLFRLNILDCMEKKLPQEKLFLVMFDTFKNLFINSNSNELCNLAVNSIGQLITYSAKAVDNHIVIRKTLISLLDDNAQARILARNMLNFLKFEHLRTLSSVACQKILLNEKDSFFDGKELKITEKVIIETEHYTAFQSLILILMKSVLNNNHRNHEQMTRILVILIIRYTENKKNWQNSILSTKKQIQLMITRFLQAMNRKNNLYPNILIKFGLKLIQNCHAPEIKCRILQLLHLYIQKSYGKQRQQLISIFETYLREYLNIKNKQKYKFVN